MGKNWTWILTVLCVLFLAACTDDDDVAPEEEGDAAGASGGDFVIATVGDIVSLDPHGNNDLPSDQVRTVIYEGLATQNEDLEIVPKLAADWEQTDETTWVFNLQKGITFHDGSEFNAEVVKANFERILDPAIASPRLNIFEMIEEVNVLDDHQVEIVTEYPFTPLLSHLTHDAGGMISKEVIDEDYQYALDEAGLDMTADEYYEIRDAGGDEHEEISEEISENLHTIVEQKPTGTGYMQFTERNPGENTVMERYDDYWQEPAHIDTLTFKVVPETGSRLAELETGEAHMVNGFEPSNVERIENNDETHMYRFHSISMEYVGFNTDKEPLDDKRVRQAISHVFNKDEVIDGIFSGTGRALDGPLQPEMLGYDESITGLEYDVERARELMAEAGYEDGFEISIITNDVAERVDLSVYLQEILQEINIEATVDQYEFGTYMEMLGNGDHDLFIFGWPNAAGDPDHGLWPLFHSSMAGAQGNGFFFENDEVDALLEEGRMESDEDARAEIYSEAQRLLIEEAPAIYMRQAETMMAYRDEVEGLYIDRYNKIDFSDVTIQ